MNMQINLSGTGKLDSIRTTNKGVEVGIKCFGTNHETEITLNAVLSKRTLLAEISDYARDFAAGKQLLVNYTAQILKPSALYSGQDKKDPEAMLMLDVELTDCQIDAKSVSWY